MTDPSAMDASKSMMDNIQQEDAVEAELLAAAPTQPTGYVRVARFISNLFGPAPISVPLIFLVTFYQTREVASALSYTALALLFLSVGPFLYILLGVRMGKLSDVDVSKRTERLGPFIFALLSTSVGVVVLMHTHAPGVLIACLLITVIIGIIMMITTLWWKISIHASAMA